MGTVTWRQVSPVVIAVLVSTLGLSALSAGAGVFAIDIRVATTAQRLPAMPFDHIATLGNRAGSAAMGVPIGIAACVVLLLSRRAPLAAIVGLATITRLTNGALKTWLDSPRPAPDLVRVTESAAGLGYPSGHAMGSTLLFGSLAIVAWRLCAGSAARCLAVTVAAVAIAVTGFGRIYVGAHWPSDVLGGYLWGAVLLIAIALLVDEAGPRLRARILRAQSALEIEPLEERSLCPPEPREPERSNRL